jgi:predicted kinase
MTKPLSSVNLRHLVRQVITEQRHSSILCAPKVIEEGVYDPGILKAVFTAGGPGSGKSYLADVVFGVRTANAKPFFENASFVGSNGLKYVNSDRFFERELGKLGINPKDLRDIADLPSDELWDIVQSADEPESARNIAKGLLQKLRGLYEQGRLGMLIDGTGGKFDKMVREKKLADAMGYDTYMLFVDTSLPVAIARDAGRSRTLGPELVEEIWQSVQDNKERFKELFGDNFSIVENSEFGPPPQEVVNKLNKFVDSPVENPLGQAWIQGELEKKKQN